jgi:CheY-like chemotaxis protein
MSKELLHLLYVDDDADIRTIVEMALGLDPGIQLRVAPSGTHALDIIDRGDWRPDVVVLDVMMPGMDGPATLAAIRLRAQMADTPILFMTARARDTDLAEYRRLGAVGTILKPFDPLQLATEIRALATPR